MADNISFRSSMNGFNRNDVISYIDALLAERSSLLLRISNLEKQITDVKTDCEKQINTYRDSALNSACSNESTISRLENEAAALKAENAALAAAFEAKTEKEAALTAELEASKLANAALMNEMSAYEDKKSDKCADCDIAKVYEARLGAAMLDAKRFSEILVKEANDKAADLFDNAFSSAQLTSEKAGAIAESITEISNQFNVSFKVLLDNMRVLGKTLDSFKNDIKLTGEKFDFTTDFVSLTGESAIEISFDAADAKDDVITLRKTDVNFDDADEFDFRVDVND